MTRNILLLFKIFLLNSLTKTVEVDNIDNVSQELIVSHYDCTKMQDKRLYSLNKVAECNISTENLYIAPATITLYQKNFEQACQQQCVLSSSMFSDTLVEFFAYVIRA